MGKSAEIGDIVCVKRKHGIYYHFGIYAGGNEVIHFSASAGNETDADCADIIKTSMEDFSRGDELFVVREEPQSVYKPFPPEEIVRRAESKLGKCRGTYSLVSNNCEHFAYWCRYGVKESAQVDSMAKTVSLLLLFPLVIGSTNLSLFDKSNVHVLDSLGMDKIVDYFKKPRRIKLLHEDSENLAIAVKEEFDGGLLRVSCCVFNKSSNTVTNIDDIAIFQAQRLEDDLKEVFGEKQMIVLQ